MGNGLKHTNGGITGNMSRRDKARVLMEKLRQVVGLMLDAMQLKGGRREQGDEDLESQPRVPHPLGIHRPRPSSLPALPWSGIDHPGRVDGASHACDVRRR